MIPWFIISFVLGHTAQGLKLLLIYAIITSENKGSLAFHEKVGYRFCAELPGCGYKFGRNLSISWMEKRSDSVDLPTAPPTHWSAFVKNDRNMEDILAILSLS